MYGDAIILSGQLVCEDVSTRLKELTPVMTGLLSGVLAMFWLLSTEQLQGYGISAILALYTVIGGSIALIRTFAERVTERLV